MESPKMEINELFNNEPVSKLVLKLGLPAMAAQIVNVLYSIVDRIFIGRIGTGTLALGAVGICGPLITALTGFAFMTGTGGSAIFSLSLGRKDYEKAQKAINNAFVLSVVISIVITVVILLIKRPLLFMLGSSEEMYAYADSYLTVYILGTLASLVGLSMNQFILAQGFAKTGMLIISAGAVLNIILDPIFIFVLNFGIAGAAWATIISQYIVLFMVLYALNHEKLPFHLKLGKIDFSVIARIVSIGIMPLLITFLDNFIILALNVQLRNYGGVLGDFYIACATVISSFLAITVTLAGITQGCATLYGFHYGAGNFKKLMQTFWNVFKTCAVFLIILTLLVQIYPQGFVRLFMRQPEEIEQASRFLKMYTLGILGIGVQYAIVDGLVAMGEVGYSMPCSLIRKFIYLLSIYILPKYFAADSIFWSGTISDVLGATVSILIFFSFVIPRIRQNCTRERQKNTV